MQPAKSGNDVPYVFISYVREDLGDVQRISKYFAERGAEYWLDREKIRLGERWQRAIRAAIQDGSTVAL